MSSSPWRVRALRSTTPSPPPPAAGDEILGAAADALRRAGHRGELGAEPRAVVRRSASSPRLRHETLTFGAPPRSRGPLASAPCSPPPGHSPSTASRLARCGSRSTSTAACRPSRSSDCPTRRLGRRASGCARRWPTVASSSRCGGSSPTWRRRACARRGLGWTWRSPPRSWSPPVSSSWEALPRLAMVGELALDGSVRRSPARSRSPRRRGRPGAEAVVVPAANGPEAAMVDGDRRDRAREPRAAARAGGGGVGAERPEPLPCRRARRPRPRPRRPARPAATFATRSRSPRPAATAC